MYYENNYFTFCGSKVMHIPRKTNNNKIITRCGVIVLNIAIINPEKKQPICKTCSRNFARKAKRWDWYCKNKKFARSNYITCKRCGMIFKISPWQAKRKYCSLLCFHKDQRNKQMRKCPTCKKLFSPIARQKYCCRECYEQSSIKNVERICVICFNTFKSGNRAAQCCSLECASKKAGQTISQKRREELRMLGYEIKDSKDLRRLNDKIYATKQRQTISDSYVKRRIHRMTNLKYEDISKDFIEVGRKYVLLKRKIKKMQEGVR